jgi:hypothetical protein
MEGVWSTAWRDSSVVRLLYFLDAILRRASTAIALWARGLAGSNVSPLGDRLVSSAQETLVASTDVEIPRILDHVEIENLCCWAVQRVV